jgi:hypothetical protein
MLHLLIPRMMNDEVPSTQHRGRRDFYMLNSRFEVF